MHDCVYTIIYAGYCITNQFLEMKESISSPHIEETY
jgi:hypothetical protein